MIPVFCKAQDNYEIQVYGSETVPKGNSVKDFQQKRGNDRKWGYVKSVS